MRAAIYRAKGRLEIEDVPTPEPGPGQILVKVGHVAACGSDVHRVFHGHVSSGVVLGHEFSGTVAEVGEGVGRWRVGDRVVGGGGQAAGASSEPVPTTGDARRVVPEWETRYTPRLLGHQGFPGTVEQGAFAEYTLMWAWQPLPVPDQVGDAQAALVEPLAVCVHAVRRSRVSLGDTVAVLGLGPIGLLVAECALVGGAARVMGVDPSPARRAAAEAFGADLVVDPARDDPVETIVTATGGGADIVFECAGAPGTLEQGLQMLRAEGRLVHVALCWEPATVLPVDWVGREVEMVCCYAYGPNGWDVALDLMARSRVDLSPLLGGGSFFPLGSIQATFDRCLVPDDVLKPIFVP